jgi:hypothetical protein
VSPFSPKNKVTYRWLYVFVTLGYLLLGLILVAPAIATTQHTINQVAPIPTISSQVPTGNDDATVEKYYDYLNLQNLSTLSEQYLFNWQFFTITYLLAAAFIFVFYVFILAWYSRLRRLDLYPVEVFNGVITERSGPVDPLSWGTFSIAGIYCVYYIVIHLIYGQLY